MFGFGGHKKDIPPDESAVRVQTIPEVFYGGNDPDVYKRVEVGAASVSVKPAQTATSTPKPTLTSRQAVAPTSHRGRTWGVGIVAVVAVVGGITWYYLRQYQPASVVDGVTPALVLSTSTPEIEPPTSTPAVPETPVATTTPTPTASTTRSFIAGGPLEFPLLNPLDAADFDHDFLTDPEEETFGTDPATWDTDKDGYYDGQEVYNLYNPQGFAPIRLVDSGLIQEYISPFAGYRIYYPQKWQLAAVDSEAQQVVITAANGDYIEIRVLKKTVDEDFGAWFGRVATGEKITDLLQTVNRFSVAGSHRRDDLTAYFVTPTAVYTLIYHPLSGGPVNYRHVMQMVTQSFRPGKTVVELPAQPILPTLPGVDSPLASSTPAAL